METSDGIGKLKGCTATDRAGAVKSCLGGGGARPQGLTDGVGLARAAGKAFPSNQIYHSSSSAFPTVMLLEITEIKTARQNCLNNLE